MTRLTDLIASALLARQQAGHIVVRPMGDAPAPVLPAYVNDGVWIVKCPWCIGGATILIDEDPRFFCCDCCNLAAGYRYVPVTIPAERREIERLLMLRPNRRNRHWLPGEPIANLVSENIEHGHSEALA